MTNTDKQIAVRLKRIESRLCHGFSKLGVDVTVPANNSRATIDVDLQRGVIIVNSLSVTLGELFSAVRSSGDLDGARDEIDVLYGGETVCVLVISEEYAYDVSN